MMQKRNAAGVAADDKQPSETVPLQKQLTAAGAAVVAAHTGITKQIEELDRLRAELKTSEECYADNAAMALTGGAAADTSLSKPMDGAREGLHRGELVMSGLRRAHCAAVSTERDVKRQIAAGEHESLAATVAELEVRTEELQLDLLAVQHALAESRSALKDLGNVADGLRKEGEIEPVILRGQVEEVLRCVDDPRCTIDRQALRSLALEWGASGTSDKPNAFLSRVRDVAVVFWADTGQIAAATVTHFGMKNGFAHANPNLQDGWAGYRAADGILAHVREARFGAGAAAVAV